MISLKVRGIEFNYSNNGRDITTVSVRFDTFNQEDDVLSINGYARVSLEEYNLHATNVEDLAELVKGKIKNKVGTEE